MPAEKRGNFGYWHDPVFLLCLATYVINREWIKPNLHHYSPFFHGHLNDSLTVPVALPIYLLFYRWIGLRPDDQPPRSWEIGLHLIVWCVFFKWFGPSILHHGVGDPLDDLSMFIGGIAAWLLWQRDWLFGKFVPRKNGALSEAV
jgi:hypothetical protein